MTRFAWEDMPTGSAETVDSATARRPPRPRAETFEDTRHRLTRLERWNIAIIKRTFEWRAVDAALGYLMRTVGSGWVHLGTRHLRVVEGLDNLAAFDPSRGYLVMANHRSFFDMYVIQMLLFRAGLRGRVLFPVRSSFFYDHPLGFFVNGLMSFFSMYPPIFRDRSRLTLNHTAFSELSRMLNAGGRAAGLHPEGTRNKGDDPYQLLPAQAGVGRLVHQLGLPVLPVFINGLGNHLPRQLLGNVTRRGRKVIVVFGKPVDLGTWCQQPPGREVFQRISEEIMARIAELGRREQALRAEVEGDLQAGFEGDAPNRPAE